MDVNHLSTDGIIDRKPVDVNIESFQYKDDNSECFATFGELKSFETSDETGDKEEKCRDEDNLRRQNIEDDSVSHKERREEISH